jgi:hypothetical protein
MIGQISSFYSDVRVKSYQEKANHIHIHGKLYQC